MKNIIKGSIIIIYTIVVGLSGYLCWKFAENSVSGIISFLLGFYLISLVKKDILSLIDNNESKPGD